MRLQPHQARRLTFSIPNLAWPVKGNWNINNNRDSQQHLAGGWGSFKMHSKEKLIIHSLEDRWEKVTQKIGKSLDSCTPVSWGRERKNWSCFSRPGSDSDNIIPHSPVPISKCSKVLFTGANIYARFFTIGVLFERFPLPFLYHLLYTDTERLHLLFLGWSCFFLLLMVVVMVFLCCFVLFCTNQISVT